MITKLHELLTTYTPSEAAAARFAEAAAILNDATVEHRTTDLRTTRWLITELADVLDPATGQTEADVVLATLQGSTHPRVKAAYEAMNGDGIDISDPQAQLLIDVLATAANWPAGLADKIKAAGVQKRSHCETAGLPPTDAAECQAHWEAGEAVEAGTVAYTTGQTLLALNATAGQGEQLTLRRTMTGEVSGITVIGPTTTLVGNSTTVTGPAKALLDSVLAAIATYEESV